jgi:hypothetical protein
VPRPLTRSRPSSARGSPEEGEESAASGPAKRLHLIGWPETIGGRPGLAEVGQQLEDVLQEISELAGNPEFSDDRDSREPATWSRIATLVRRRLVPRINVATLGRPNAAVDLILYGAPWESPIIGDWQCFLMTLPPPSSRDLFDSESRARTPQELENLELWAWAVHGAEIRGQLLRALDRSNKMALVDVYAKRSIEDLPFSPEPRDQRGGVELNWGEDADGGGEA